MFFLNGLGDTGKTKLQNTVLGHLRSKGRIALAVASSGIASTLLEGGQTAHSRFKIPLDADASSTCAVKKHSDLAELLRKTALIFWDEAPMQNQYDMEAVDCLLQDLCNNKNPFAGKVICFCGDFRQILPVIPDASPGKVIASCLQSASFWENTEILYLTENMRLQDPQLDELGRRQVAQFANNLLRIGDGITNIDKRGSRSTMAPWSFGQVRTNKEAELIQLIYGDLGSGSPSNNYLDQRALLALTNARIDRLNQIIADRVPSTVHLRFSVNKPLHDEDKEHYTPEYLATILESSLPEHELRLKIGMPVMLLRNLEPPRQCNGTRIWLTYIGNKILRGEIIGGQFKGEEVC